MVLACGGRALDVILNAERATYRLTCVHSLAQAQSIRNTQVLEDDLA